MGNPVIAKDFAKAKPTPPNARTAKEETEILRECVGEYTKDYILADPDSFIDKRDARDNLQDNLNSLPKANAELQKIAQQLADAMTRQIVKYFGEDGANILNPNEPLPPEED